MLTCRCSGCVAQRSTWTASCTMRIRWILCVRLEPWVDHSALPVVPTELPPWVRTHRQQSYHQQSHPADSCLLLLQISFLTPSPSQNFSLFSRRFCQTWMDASWWMWAQDWELSCMGSVYLKEGCPNQSTKGHRSKFFFQAIKHRQFDQSAVWCLRSVDKWANSASGGAVAWGKLILIPAVLLDLTSVCVCVISGLCVQFSFPADWFRDQWRICETAERHCGQVSADRQNQGTNNTHRVHTISWHYTCTLWRWVCDQFHFLQVLHTDVCLQQALLHSTDVLIMNNVFEFFMEPPEQARWANTLKTPQSPEKCVHAAGLADVVWLLLTCC